MKESILAIPGYFNRHFLPKSLANSMAIQKKVPVNAAKSEKSAGNY